MPKIYAYWEKSIKGWNLVAYHGDKPGKSVGGQDEIRIGPYTVPDDQISIDGSPMFGKIKQSFPEPGE